MSDARLLERAYLIRLVEERLLALFSEGKVAGTTHTCIGQELSAVMLAESLDPERDIIFSNHRCHGHFIAWTDDVEGLIAEIMGTSDGVCTGIGGSQHLCGRRFYSNGVQGGIVPVAAGLAFAQKQVGRRSVVTVCIGDGTLGEGVIYETFNMAVKWGLPLLILLENNRYAQSTHQQETLAGDICARAAAFGMTTFSGNTWEYAALGETLSRAVSHVREKVAPAFVRVDTYRLAAHSKSDDNRDPAEIAQFSSRDPVNELLASALTPRDTPPFVSARERVDRAVAAASAGRPREVPPASVALRGGVGRHRVTQLEEGTQLEGINRALRAWMRENDRVVLIGEDIRSPYGGAFKITRGISDEFPGRVLNAPISEAGIVGIGNGLALGGARPIVEIMFGDFLTLCCDQLVNHAAKFKSMYAEKARAPLIVRTPMGGGRGYGPTHSQNLEKHFVGVPGLAVVVMHRRTQVGAMYEALRDVEDPVLIIENKLLYKERPSAALPEGYSLSETNGPLPSTVLSPSGQPDITVVAFGRMSLLAEHVAAALLDKEEIASELIFPLLVSPLDGDAIRESVARTGRLLVVEEGAASFDLASEVIASVVTTYAGQKPLRVRRLAAHPAPIPSSMELERSVLPSEETLTALCLELFDA